MRQGSGVLVALLLGVTAQAGPDGPVSAAGLTERVRSLGRALDLLLVSGAEGDEEPHTLLFLVDATPSLRETGFEFELAEALERTRAQRGSLRIGVVRLGKKGRAACAPTHVDAKVLEAVQGMLATARLQYQNVYAEVRRWAIGLARLSGSRGIVLVTLENGDVEDELERTASLLRRTRIRVSALAREAFLSDTYWITHRLDAPKGVRLTGADAAFVEIPWGWIFQVPYEHETVPSGFAAYGISRLAAASGGRVYLHSPPAPKHRCRGLVGYSCFFCQDDHLPARLAYRPHRLSAMAPLVGRRADVFAAVGRDPYFRAASKAWSSVSKAGLVLARPSLRETRGTWKPALEAFGRIVYLGDTLAFERQAKRARKLVPVCERILADLEVDMEEAHASGGSHRYRAVGDVTRVMLHLARVNLIAFAAWCEEAAPVLVERAERAPVPPEAPEFDGDDIIRGITFTSLNLCHGVRPIMALKLPGGGALRRELEALDEVVGEFLARHAHTPFGLLVRRAGVARFHLQARPGTASRRASSELETTPATRGERPAREGPITVGEHEAPTSGGD